MQNNFIAPPTDRVWNTFCDTHQYWYCKTAVIKECPKCQPATICPRCKREI